MRRSAMNETKRCEYCGKDIYAHYMTCPLCGGHLHEKIDPVNYVCPRCNVPLQAETDDGNAYDLCPKCGGMWLDRSRFHKATRESDVYRKEDFQEGYYREPASDPLAYIPCVRCGKMMNRKNFGRISGVIIDECGRHGVWLDRGELQKIRHFIADGGLEISQDREIEKRRAEVEALATKVGDIEFVQKVIHFWNFKRWLFGD
jgi:Zn-finger nucleic acid-binding protein